MLERVDAVFSEEVRRSPAASALLGIAPSNAHLCEDETTRSLLATVAAFQALDGSHRQGRLKAAGRCIDIRSRQPLKDDFDEH
jgi:hypothetical protein